ncbi:MULTISPECIES: GNAT family N-acetyltransferase [unclassified Arthrobacter]|uniref:GNAT family N-acetyltransferase n=1 Tax=unclassified Arthrobacter TaxID=235627 RepID=UPI001E5CAB33|nr:MULTISPECIES: GNAT family N-acetyltransferase [unclassified Arthrobacter]MCC9145170.1 GNAT family N-acetyltransferase [Arthrobacter sp. zg-Y919]MDK1276398.1 GNAT family N-acetyltransferase [Arthrobacter sp. zg.Y919]WIB02001.1 GNAT family N-acetyltransferase [Arthrobacter sp. zg-Y919]
MQICPLDLHDDVVMADAYRIECAATQSVRTGWTPLVKEARFLAWRTPNGWRNHVIGAWHGTTLLGFAAGMNSADTPDTTWIFVWVDPAHQNAGVGSALARAAEDASPTSTTRFVASAYRSTPAEIDAFTRNFACPLGYSPATTETVVELVLRDSQLAGPTTAPGYEISTYVNGVPEHFREQVGQIKGLVDAEAPNGELGWGETTVSPEEYAEEMNLWVAQGSTVFESIAVDEAGNVAAWTCLVAAADPERPAQIEGTLVVSAHRGHGLGAAVKLASLQRASETGNVSKVRTSSDDRNVWMRSINTRMGFTPVETEIILQKATVTA